MKTTQQVGLINHGVVGLASIALTLLAFSSVGLASPGDSQAQYPVTEIADAKVVEISFATDLPATIPADPRRALSFAFSVEDSGHLSGMHLRLVADVHNPIALSAIVVGPNGATWALDPEAFNGQRTGKIDTWLDLLEEGTDFAREAAHETAGGAWTLQVFQLQAGTEGTLVGLEVVLETVPASDPEAGIDDFAPSANLETESSELETERFPLEAAAVAQDGCGEGGCGCRVFAGGSGVVPRGVLLGLFLGVILFLSLRGRGSHSALIDDGGE